MIQLHLDAHAVKIKHLKQLAKLRDWEEITGWFVQHAGVTAEEFDELSLAELTSVGAELNAQIMASTLPKANGALSSSP